MLTQKTESIYDVADQREGVYGDVVFPLLDDVKKNAADLHRPAASNVKPVLLW